MAKSVAGYLLTVTSNLPTDALSREQCPTGTASTESPQPCTQPSLLPWGEPEVCARIRALSDAPILILSACRELPDQAVPALLTHVPDTSPFAPHPSNCAPPEHGRLAHKLRRLEHQPGCPQRYPGGRSSPVRALRCGQHELLTDRGYGDKKDPVSPSNQRLAGGLVIFPTRNGDRHWEKSPNHWLTRWILTFIWPVSEKPTLPRYQKSG